MWVENKRSALGLTLSIINPSVPKAEGHHTCMHVKFVWTIDTTPVNELNSLCAKRRIRGTLGVMICCLNWLNDGYKNAINCKIILYVVSYEFHTDWPLTHSKLGKYLFLTATVDIVSAVLDNTQKKWACYMTKI